MNFRHIEVFFAVMSSGSITSAAKLLNVSQPSVTTTIKHAEQRLGFALFIRESGRLVPTREARVLFDEVSRAHESLEIVRHLAEKMRDGQAGHARIAATNTLSMAILPDALKDFSASHPNYSYSIHTLNTEDMMNKLDERHGNYHLGFSHLIGDVSDLNYRTLGESDLVCVTPSEWNLGQCDISELAERPFISMYDKTPIALLYKKMFTQIGIKPTRFARAHSHILAGTLVSKGLGYTILDTLTLHILVNQQQLTNLTVTQLPIDLKLPVMAVYPGNRGISDPAHHFIQSFQQVLQKTLDEVQNY